MSNFYVVSAMSPNSNGLGQLKKYPTMEEAIEAAKLYVEDARQEGRGSSKNFFILEAVATVGDVPKPIHVEYLGCAKEGKSDE